MNVRLFNDTCFCQDAKKTQETLGLTEEEYNAIHVELQKLIENET